MAKKKQFPMDDLETPRLQGEKWVDMKGFAGIYQVSSFGRIRSVDRKVRFASHWNGKKTDYSKPQVIRKQKLQRKENKYAGTPHYECTVSLWRNNKEKMMVVSMGYVILR